MQLLNTKASVADKDGSGELVVNEGKFEFKDVKFPYDSRKPMIKGVSLQAGVFNDASMFRKDLRCVPVCYMLGCMESYNA